MVIFEYCVCVYGRPAGIIHKLLIGQGMLANVIRVDREFEPRVLRAVYIWPPVVDRKTETTARCG